MLITLNNLLFKQKLYQYIVLLKVYNTLYRTNELDRRKSSKIKRIMG